MPVQQPASLAQLSVNSGGMSQLEHSTDDHLRVPGRSRTVLLMLMMRRRKKKKKKGVLGSPIHSTVNLTSHTVQQAC